jgi:hypothetical protein
MDVGGIVIIGFPITIIPSNSSTCWIQNVQANCTYSKSLSTMNITISSIVSSNSNLILTITNITNPPSFAPIGFFTLKTFLPYPFYAQSESTY